ncbi:MAG: hypothetical protein WC141_02445 [Arcobacteraceae bacterium]
MNDIKKLVTQKENKKLEFIRAKIEISKEKYDGVSVLDLIFNEGTRAREFIKSFV